MFSLSRGDSPNILTRDCVTRVSHWQITSFVNKESIFDIKSNTWMIKTSTALCLCSVSVDRLLCPSIRFIELRPSSTWCSQRTHHNSPVRAMYGVVFCECKVLTKFFLCHGRGECNIVLYRNAIYRKSLVLRSWEVDVVTTVIIIDIGDIYKLLLKMFN